MFLAQALRPDRSCQNIVNDTALKRLQGGLPRCRTHTGAYCRARQRWPLDRVSTLVRHTGKLISAGAHATWLWNSRRIRLVDGATVTMPDTAANQAVYPQQGGQKPGLGFPICRIVAITCLSTGAVLNAAMGNFKGQGGCEQTLLRTLLDTFEAGDMLLGDALYGTYFLLAERRSRQVDVLFEQHGARKRSTDFSQGEKLGDREHLITLTKPKVRSSWMSEEQYDAAPGTLVIREWEAGGKLLITSHTCAVSIPKQALKALYQSRWQVELAIRNIKTPLGMETLSCKTPQTSGKERWVYLLAYNLIRLLMAQSALLADVPPRTLSFKHTLQLWLGWNGTRKPSDNPDSISGLLLLVAEQSVGNRPGRLEPRALNRRPKPYPLLTKPRGETREDVKKYGHPKKLK